MVLWIATSTTPTMTSTTTTPDLTNVPATSASTPNANASSGSVNPSTWSTKHSYQHIVPGVGELLLDAIINQPANTGPRDVHVTATFKVPNMPLVYASSWMMCIPDGRFGDFMHTAAMQDATKQWSTCVIWHFFNNSGKLSYVANIPLESPVDAAKHEEIKGRVDTLEKTAQQLKTTLTQREADVTDLVTRNIEHANRVDVLTTEKNTLTETNAQLSAKVADFESGAHVKTAHLMVASNQCFATENLALLDEVEQLKAAVASLSDTESLATDNRNLIKSNQYLSAEVDRLEGEAAQLRDKIAEQNTTLDHRATVIQTVKADASKRIAKLMIACSPTDWNDGLTDMLDDVSCSEIETAIRQARVKTSEQINGHLREIEQLKTAIAEQNTGLDQLVRENDGLRAEVVDLNQHLRASASVSNAKLDTLLSTETVLRSRVASLEKDIDKERSSADKLAEDVRQLACANRKLIESNDAQVAALKDEVAQLSAKIVKLETSIATLVCNEATLRAKHTTETDTHLAEIKQLRAFLAASDEGLHKVKLENTQLAHARADLLSENHLMQTDAVKLSDERDRLMCKNTELQKANGDLLAHIETINTECATQARTNDTLRADNTKTQAEMVQQLRRALAAEAERDIHTQTLNQHKILIAVQNGRIDLLERANCEQQAQLNAVAAAVADKPRA